MASGKRHPLKASGVIAADATTTYSSVVLLDTDSELQMVTEVSSRTDGTFTATLQHSHDGTTFVTLVAGSAISANGIDVARPAAGLGNLKYVRLSLLAGSTTSGATIECTLFVKNSKA